MNKKIFAAAAAAIGVAAVATLAVVLNNQKKINDYKEAELSLPKDFTYTAHTGCMGTKENSLESIEKAVEFGADTVEFDLNFNSNNEPVLAHDTPKGGEVTLDEAFAKMAEYPGITVNVDVKSVAALEKVLPAAQKHGVAERIFFTGIHDGFVEAAAENGGGVPYYLNVEVEAERKQDEEYLLSLVEKVKNSGATGINFNKKNATKELVDIFHENGLLVSVWTVDSEAEMCEILTYAPDNITTRKPDVMQKLLKSKNIG